MGCVMKRIIFVLLAIAPYASFAAAPSTSCPTSYVAVVEEDMDIANSSYTSAGTATSCLVIVPSGSCIMYAPANTRYSDRSGTYIFEQACPME